MSALVVDVGARIITGLAIPYDRAVFVGGRHYQFVPEWCRYDVVPLLRDHDFAQNVGRVVVISETDEGLSVKATVHRGPLGDRMLAEADAQQLGLSPRFVPDPDGLRLARSRPGLRLVFSAWLVELSLTARPAFGR